MTGFEWRLFAHAAPLIRIAAALVLVVGALVLGITDAAAQELSAAERTKLETRKDALFQQMLKNPANLDVTFAYADVAARLGDSEGAISALQRMLLFNPNLPRVDLELGALYFRLGSYDAAKSYFDKALSANPPPEVRAKIEEYQAAIARQNATHLLTGYVMFGAQYQSDANVAPGSALVNSPFGPLLLNNEFVKKADVNIFASSGVLYSYDLGTQTRDTLEIGATTYINHYFQVDRLDLEFAEATIGPRFNFPHPAEGIDSISIKPYAILDVVGLGENMYFNTYGAGFSTDTHLPADLTLSSVIEFRQKNFSDAPDRPVSRLLNGNDTLVSVRVKRPAPSPIAGTAEFGLEFDFLNQDTRAAWYTNKAYGGTASYVLHYPDPTNWAHLPWQTALYGGRTWDNYASPDPCCSTSGNPFVFSPSDRYDRRWRFGISQTVPVAANVSVVLQAQRDVISSNLSLYAYTSDSVLVGTEIRF